jgi:hypothetical protein
VLGLEEVDSEACADPRQHATNDRTGESDTRLGNFHTDLPGDFASHRCRSFRDEEEVPSHDGSTDGEPLLEVPVGLGVSVVYIGETGTEECEGESEDGRTCPQYQAIYTHVHSFVDGVSRENTTDTDHEEIRTDAVPHVVFEVSHVGL